MAMIREVSRKEYTEQRYLIGIAFAAVLFVSIILPSVFWYSLQQAEARAATNTAAQLVLTNFRSYPVFIETQWLARNLARILCLLALIGGASAIAGEREARTLPLLFTSSGSLRSVVVVKFVFLATWLFLVMFASSALLAALSLAQGMPFPAVQTELGSLVAWANAMAFLGVVFAASSFAPRAIVAGALGLALGVIVSVVLGFAGLNGTALATNLVAVDGSVIWRNAAIDLGVCAVIGALGLAAALFEVGRRRAT